MAERSFKKEVLKLRAGDGEIFRGEGILAVTKALLQSGVSYVGGYQGSPISHLMDVLNDAQDILAELGTSFEASGSEATAAAMLSASVNYPLRGAVTWKSTVGTNVASDALANLASSGVTGGAMVIIGEDYGEGSSIMQERSHAFAMKSQMWLIDPRPNMNSIVELIEKSFQLSEASNTPLFFMMRIRSCHATGEFIAKDNQSPAFTPDKPLTPHRDAEKIILPPVVYQQEQDKITSRWPRAIEFIKTHGMNEVFNGKHVRIGLIMQGGLYNTTIRALQRLGLSNVFGDTDIPLYVMNVTYPLVDDEVIEFCTDKDHVLVLEEGQPEYIEHNLHAILRKADMPCKLYGKDIFPAAGEYSGSVMLQGLSDFLQKTDLGATIPTVSSVVGSLEALAEETLSQQVPPRPAGLCTGCPERPLFSALKQLQAEMGEFHISSDIGCHSFATLPPFNLGNTIMGYGLSLASSSAVRNTLAHRAISIMGDGGFWHNGLSSGVASAVFNQHDGLLIIINNGYSAATGGQDIPSLVKPNNKIAVTVDVEQGKREEQQTIQDACRGAGVSWIKTLSTYNIEAMKETLRDALTTDAKGLKVIVAEGECMLNKQRRVKPLMNQAIDEGKRTVKARFVIDSDTCTGDHACIRLSGCPSLTIKANPDPLREDPVSYVDNSCVGCGVCGENVHSAVLCPSFSRVDVIHNPSMTDKLLNKLRRNYIGWVQKRVEQKRQGQGL